MTSKEHATKPTAFVVAAASSSSGKTVVSLGIMEALKRRGLVVQPFKAGPDYIDPGHHAALLGAPSYNLDTWMMGEDGALKTFKTHLAGSDVAIVEGVMGLYDGKAGSSAPSPQGSTAHLAGVLGLPVLLVVNAEKTAQSAAALVRGFEVLDPKVEIRWVVFNRAAGPSHFETLKAAVERASGVRVLGWLPRHPDLAVPERHLGLVTSADLKKGRWKRFVRAAGTLAEERLDLDALLAPKARRRSAGLREGAGVEKTARPVARIAVARDAAFCFYYEENIEILKEKGAEIVYFSPLRSKGLPRGTDGVYLGGGYPELHAPRLEANSSMREALRSRALDGMPVLAECGGLIYLGERLVDASGEGREMAGVFGFHTAMQRERAALGYREVRLSSACPFGSGTLRGHEYRYSRIRRRGGRGAKAAFEAVLASDALSNAAEGLVRANSLATYVHLHFASNPGFARGFVQLCASVRAGKKSL